MVMSQTLNIVSLVTRAQNGDRHAYGTLYEHFQPSIYAMALSRLRNADEARELAQEVLVQGMVKISQLHKPAAFPAWLRQIAVRMVVNRVSRANIGITVGDDVLHEQVAATASPPEALMSREQSAVLRKGLACLKSLDRDTLMAFYFNGQSLETMSRKAKAPIGTIKRRLHVARKRLRYAVAQFEG
jgi:RNA polymerase sigma-70 factor (ECF subfamily)